MKRVAIVCKQDKRVDTILEEVIQQLVKRGIKIAIARDGGWASSAIETVSEDELVEDIDMMVVLGGDGTLIHTAHLLDGRDVPILGVNLGTLGFMTEVPLGEFPAALDMALNGQLEFTERRTLRATLMRASEEVLSRVVLNDAVINKGALARIIKLQAHTTQGVMTTYRGDGLIVSTPTGSTAYNMAAGGPVLFPSLGAFVLTPICPHTFANRPVVLPDDKEVFIDLMEANGEVYLTLDGQEGVQMLEDDRLVIRRSLITVRIVNSLKHDYFQILRQKLGWGQC
jgi:NAD+ kinase